jgi:hypothetical protein
MPAMQAESLEVLEKADVAPAQARAIVRAIEIEIAGAKDTLATKSDLASLRQDLRQEMAELRQELRQQMSDLRLELKGDLLRLEAKLETKIHEAEAASRASCTRRFSAKWRLCSVSLTPSRHTRVRDIDNVPTRTTK